MINKKFAVSLASSLLAMIAVSVTAESNTHQPFSQYSLLLAGRSTNPWALPPAPERAPNFQRPPRYRNQQYQNDQTDVQYPGFRFVTPEILESLKQTQMRTQQSPGRSSNRRSYRYQQSVPPQMMSEPPVPGYYGFPSTTMGAPNPLYDVPAVSPWGNGPDVLYRGESFPWVPDAAIGGIPPMNVEPYIENNATGDVESESKQYRDNVFNPFTFGSNGNL
jgi:hypothetical protein